MGHCLNSGAEAASKLCPAVKATSLRGLGKAADSNYEGSDGIVPISVKLRPVKQTGGPLSDEAGSSNSG